MCQEELIETDNNALLQAYALDGTHIRSARQKLENLELCDPRIRGDISQHMTVEAALEEKDIFLIQGPPGTGKTTVIREIILQKLKEAPESKILVVSQANVAVDNVLQGLLRAKGFLTGFIRCGREDKIGDAIKPYSFEEIYGTYVCRLKKRLAEDPENRLLAKWDEIVSSEGKYNPNVGELILRGKPIIGATCVGLAQKRIGLDRVEYDLVIVDEAGKALPAEILIPYVRGKKVILIGDHMQLPPTVHPALLDPEKIEIEDRDVYEDDLFHTSFFEKLFNSAPETNKAMLTTQYRMPGVIGTMVSQLFYGGALKNGGGVEKKQPLFFDKNITLINMKGELFRENVPKGSSVTNLGEAELAVRLLRAIRQKISAAKAKVAVITPYKGQRRELLKVLEKRAPYLLFQGIEVNTVDAFQGDEAEIVVFCCTRTHTPTNFFEDPRRINVAFSRAKNELILLGSLDYFRKFGETSVLPAVAEYIRLHGKVLNTEEVPSYRPAGARDPGQAGNTPNRRKAASGNRKKNRPPED